jgi:hypothetical protein
MTDITPKRTSEAWRSYAVHTHPWDVIAEFYRDRITCHGLPMAPMLRVVEALAASPIATQIHGATSHEELCVSDCPDFRIGDSTLQISYHATERVFRFHHRSFSGHDDQKTCDEAEVLQTLRLFLRLKYGILFEIPVA